MKRYEGALRRLSILFILINLLSPLSINSTLADDGTPEPDPIVQSQTNTVPDSDADGFADNVDNCPAIYNPGQSNADGDSLGDACDTDADGDGVDDAAATQAAIDAEAARAAADAAATQAAIDTAATQAAIDAAATQAAIDAANVEATRVAQEQAAADAAATQAAIDAEATRVAEQKAAADAEATRVAQDEAAKATGGLQIHLIGSDGVVLSGGATLKLVDRNGTEVFVTDGNVDGTARDTDGVQDGVIRVHDLLNGPVTIYQVDGQSGYDFNPDVSAVDVAVNVIPNQTDTRVEIVNDPIPVEKPTLANLTPADLAETAETPAVCAEDGTLSAPSLALPATDGVTYSVVEDGPYAAAQTVTIVASLNDATTSQWDPAFASDVWTLDPNTNTYSRSFTFSNVECETPGATLSVAKSVVALNGETLDGEITELVAGDVLTYEIVVINDGKVDLTNVVVIDDLKGVDFDASGGKVGDLAAGASATVTVTYTVTDEDVANGSVTNSANATANAGDEQVNAEPASVTVGGVNARMLAPLAVTADVNVDYSAYEPGSYDSSIINDPTIGPLTVEALTPGGFVQCGSYLYYQTLVTASSAGDFTFGYTFESQGGVSYSGSERVAIQSQSGGSATLTNNGDGTYTLVGLSVGSVVEVVMVSQLLCEGTITGQINVATRFAATGIGAQTIPLKGQGEQLNPVLGLTKTATNDDGPYALGETVTYSIVATNNGNTTLTGVTVNDPTTGVVFNAASCVWSGGTAGTLAPSQTVTCSATHVITEADIIAGKFDNNATADSNETLPVNAPESVITVAANRSLTLSKLVNGQEAITITAPQTVTYTYLVTNSGNVTLENVSVVDDKIAAGTIDCGAAAGVQNTVTLLPGASANCSVTYDVSQTQIDAGTAIVNTAYATNGTTTSPNDTATINITRTPALTITKTSGGINLGTNGRADVGDTITYTIVVTNTGNTTLTNIAVNDVITGGTGTFAWAEGTILPIPSIPSTNPDSSVTLTGTYTLTQADINAGATIRNCATATAGTATGTACAQDTIVRTPSLSLAKRVYLTANPGDSPGTNSLAITEPTSVTYTFRVTNTGNVTVNSLSIADAVLTGRGVPAPSCPSTTLAPGAFTLCTVTMQVTQADIDAGTNIVNTARANALTPQQTPVQSNPDNATLTFTQAPSLTAAKTSQTNFGANGRPDVGDTITYTIIVTNTGNTTLNNVALNDALTGTSVPATVTWTSPAGFTGTIATIPATNPDTSVTITGTYTLTQADIDTAATIRNCIDLTLDTNSADDCATNTLNRVPSLLLDKVASDADETNEKTVTVDSPQTVTYTFTVTNTGNVTIDTLAIADPILAAPATCVATTLAPAASTTCSGTYAVTQANINAGTDIPNTATATGLSPSDATVTSNESSALIDIVSIPGVEAAKTGTGYTDTNANGRADAGEKINYTITVTNTGNTTLNNVVVGDVLKVNGTTVPNAIVWTSPAGFTGTIATIPATNPDSSVTVTGTYTLTQADIDAGATIENCVVVTNDGNTQNNCRTDTITRTPSITLDKTATAVNGTTVTTWPVTGLQVNDVVTYTMTARNTGNVTLTNVTISDAKLGTLSCTPVQPATLLPNATLVCSGTYTVTQTDVNLGVPLINTASVVGTPPQGSNVTAQDTETVYPIAQRPSLVMLKTATRVNGLAVPGAGGVYPVIDLELDDIVTYTLTATNNGNVTLGNVLITDTRIGTLTCTVDGAGPTVTNGLVSLNPGQYLECVGTYTVTQGDIDAQVDIVNVGTADSNLTTPVSDTETVKVILANPLLTLDKTANTTTYDSAGDVLAYTLVATNSGNVTLHNVTITDPKLGTLTCTQPITLAPGASLTCTGAYSVVQADVDAGKVDNIATADSDETPAVTDTATVPGTQSPSLILSKLVNGAEEFEVTTPGTVTYTFLVTNDGNVTLKNLFIDDQVLDDLGVDDLSCLVTTLAPGASTTCTATYDVTQGDIDAGTDIVNTATAVGADPKEIAVVSNEDDATITFKQTPGLVIEKTSDVVDGIGLGETITYTFAVQNTGNVTLNDVVINDSLDVTWEETYADGIVGTINPGETIEVTASYVVTAADTEAGFVLNCATATDGETDSNESCVRDGVEQLPGLAISKVCPDPETVKRVGDEVTYAVTISNTGDVTIYGIAVTESREGTFDPEFPSELAPGESFISEFTTTILPEDAETTSLDNEVRVTGYALLEGPVDDVEEDAGTATGIPVVFLNQAANESKVEFPLDIFSTINCPFDPYVGITLLKTADVVDADEVVAGTVITYSFEVTNISDVALDDVVVVDPLPGLTWDAAYPGGFIGDLALGETKIITATYTVTDADVDAGFVKNCAVVDYEGLLSNESCVDVPTDGHPGLAIIKTAHPYKVRKAGDVITYTFVVTNTGDVPLTDVVVVDEMLEAAGVGIPAIGDLAPGESKTVTARYTVTAEDMKLKEICNTAFATDGEIESEPDTATVKVYHPKPAPQPTPEPTPSPAPAPAVRLPNTGSGDDTGGTTSHGNLWIAAATMAAVLGYGALTLRKRDTI